MWTARVGRRTISALAIGGVMLSLGLAGCGSDSESTKDTTGSTIAETTGATTQSAPTPEPGQKPTISSYIKENGITDAAVQQGEPGAPTIQVPLPGFWAIAGPEDTPSDAYRAFVYTGPDAGGTPPKIVTWYRKLTGNVDPQKILDVAGGELSNLPGWEPMNPGSTTELSGYKAFQLGGTWEKDGKKEFATQKTVVIPGDGAVFVLQFDVMALDTQIDIVGPATLDLDGTTITPA